MVKRALLIGANYTATPVNKLNGCIDDIVNIHNMLIDAYAYEDSNIVMLRDDNPVPSKLPTKANILANLASILSVSSPADEVWVHYSGHGSQVKDANGDEIDRLDEMIVPCDYPRAGFITDDELFNVIAKSKCRLLLFFDSCNSGTVGDLQYSVNYANGVYYRSTNNNKAIQNPNVIMMSGCKDNQTSADAYDNFAKQAVGAFTSALITTLRTYQHNIDIKNLYGSVCNLLKSAKFSQVPVLSFSTLNPEYKFARSISTSTIQPKVVSVVNVSNPTKSILPNFNMSNIISTQSNSVNTLNPVTRSRSSTKMKMRLI